MKIMHVTTGVVGALALLLLAPLEANAGARGVGVRPSHVGGQHVVRGHRALARHHFRSFRNQAFGLWHMDIMDTATTMSRPTHTAIQ
jgi:hypothetical protein